MKHCRMEIRMERKENESNLERPILSNQPISWGLMLHLSHIHQALNLYTVSVADNIAKP